MVLKHYLGLSKLIRARNLGVERQICIFVFHLLDVFQDSWICERLRVAEEDRCSPLPMAAAAALATPHTLSSWPSPCAHSLLFSTALSSEGGSHY